MMAMKRALGIHRAPFLWPICATMAGMTRLFLCLLALLSLSFDVQAAGRFQADCFDVAAVGRLTEQVALPQTPDAEEILPDAVFRMRFQVEQHFTPDATERWLQVHAVQHVGFSPAIRHFLILARRGPGTDYGLSGLVASVVRDRDGQFVIPLSRLTADTLQGQGSAALATRLIRYRAGEA
ncbi:hypothetical protein [Niveispirillum fermenti]|uniref:hypothetical protein n=1 Tax=Niveispirillum fermenti TaxID=1233113 RepID=UPI004042D34E